ncbi:MAG: HflK protein [Candidatus Fischerbacteria bacterium RBG_13_37_8]|uniref:Protein HflK n=1 Tax=Candidatus Fischerbacteria bacterium RBG_13_37_8 TaxID=1817863 RepID=A0A1F5V6C8_9BACT|nr:MAG: HflK protein [Candidatus Fischerbacteria bacterium RBG_13_37_8]
MARYNTYDLTESFKNFKVGKYLTVIWVIIAFIILISCMYQIGPGEAGIIQRFGKHVRTTHAGLHLKLPAGIEKLTKVNIEHVFKEEFGYRTRKAGVVTEYEDKKYQEESLMLTGDLNCAEVEWIVQFKIAEPEKYLFKVRRPETTLRDLSEAVTRQVIGDRTVTEVLTVGREEIANQIQLQLQELINLYEVGIKVITVKLQDVNPPDPVKPAFNEVNEAKQEKERSINQAWEDYNKVVPRAEGEAQQIIAEAEGYEQERVNRALGEAKRFSSVLEEYRKAPEVTKQRLYLETLNEIIPQVKQIYVIDPAQKSVIPFIPLPKTSETQ